MALSTSRVIIGGDHCPHLVPSSAITAASSSSVSGPTLRATASTCSEVMIPAAHARGQGGVLGGQGPGAGQTAGLGEAHPRAASTAPGPTRGRLPAVVAACIRRASSYSTAANAPASTSTSAFGRSPASRPIAGRSELAHPVARAHNSATSTDAQGNAPTARGSSLVCWSSMVLVTGPPPSELMFEHYPGPLTTPGRINPPVDSPGDDRTQHPAPTRPAPSPSPTPTGAAAWRLRARAGRR